MRQADDSLRIPVLNAPRGTDSCVQAPCLDGMHFEAQHWLHVLTGSSRAAR
jgi:hypothetical protein